MRVSTLRKIISRQIRLSIPNETLLAHLQAAVVSFIHGGLNENCLSFQKVAHTLSNQFLSVFCPKNLEKLKEGKKNLGYKARF
jgi:hypothetical protein